MVTPFLKGLNDNGGTLYVFPSVSKDLTRTFVSNDYEFKFSHFACLNIPDIYSGDVDSSTKGLYLETSPFNLEVDNTTEDQAWTSDGMGNALAEHFQNYMFNFEVAILNGEGDNDDYDNTIMTNVSEKVFFNWLQKIGGISFDGNIEKFSYLSDRTVQYIGNIDVVNTVEVDGDSYEELYIHIPSTVGASTTVKFREGSETDNKNYLDKKYEIGGTEFIIGRGEGDENSNGLSIEAIFDDDTTNTYTGDTGYTIDFRDSIYADGSGIETMNGNSTENFEFNAILIYYDFCEKMSSTSNTKYTSTNLYGILFLDNVTDSKAGTDSTDNTNTSYRQGYIQRYPKKRETIYGNGNSFAMKVDLKIDTIPDSCYEVEKYTDPNSAYSMSLYQKAILQLQKCIDLFYEQKNYIIDLQQRVDNIETKIIGLDTISTLNDEISRLYNLYADVASVDTDTLLKLIEVNSKKLNSIINGGTDIKLQYDTDVIKSGTGINLTKSTNSVTISTDQSYSMNVIYTDTLMDTEINSDNPLDTSASTRSCYIPLKQGKNLANLYITDCGSCTDSIYVYIDDDNNSWVTGQSFKLYLNVVDGDLTFDDDVDTGMVININDKNIEIPALSLGAGKIIEIICTGDDEYIHLIS